MKYLPYEHAKNVSLAAAAVGLIWQRAARVLPPMGAWAVSMLRSPHVRQLAARVLLLLGLLIQIVLLLVVGYLIDLSISLMDLWAELARKHLELTL